MAGNSPPRRSSRARTAQSQSHHSSTTSSLSGRPERTTRSLNKAASPQKSTPSLSDEPPDESVASTDDIPTRRRRTRAQDQGEDRDKAHPPRDTIEMAGDPDEIQEEEEAVRCVCGFEEYPGPPPLEDEKKHGAKDTIDVEPLLPSDINDDVAGLFVQCDICKVWQHGACVGIMSEEASPDEYFCDECRKDLHKIHIASNGQRYSRYLPLVRNRRKSSTRSRSPKGRDGKDSRETRSGRQSSLTQTSKRRSTMNSRDAAYDEEEQLRRAIEASKEDVSPEAELVTRRTKRGRSNSEEKQEIMKRQRTKSKSPSQTEDDNEHAVVRDDSDETSNLRNGSKKLRNPTTRTQSNQKEKSEKEERERQRAEAAKKRNGRAERRRADGSTPASTILAKGLEAQADTDSDPSEELPLSARVVSTRTTAEKAPTITTDVKTDATMPPEPPPSSQPTPDTPPTSAPAQNASKSKPRPKKGKGKNQYTKDREVREETSPVRSQSREGHENGHGHGHGHGQGHTHHGRTSEAPPKSHSRAKGGFNSKVSMADMRRKAHAMLDYISRTQVEMAGEMTPPDQESRRPSAISIPQGKENGTPAVVIKPPAVTNGDSSGSKDAPKDFKDLSSMEMMDRLTGDLVKWQNQFAS